MTVLVTGATGAIGRHFVPALLDRGVEVRALTRAPEKAEAAGLTDAVDLVRGDLTDPATFGPALFDGVDRAFVFPALGGIDAFVDAAVGAGRARAAPVQRSVPDSTSTT